MKILKFFSLTIIGILLSLLILEISLQITGFTLTTIKKFRNKIINDPNTITILCLGESTTDGQWPPILQKILDEKSKNKKFNVIDEGHAGKNTEYLFYEIIEKKLLKYSPDIIISMIGANDDLSDKPYIMQNEHWYYKLRLYRLIILIKDHIENKLKYTELNKALKDINVPEKVTEKIKEISHNTDETKNSENLYLIKTIINDYPDMGWYDKMIPALVNPYFTEIILKKQNKYVFKLDDFLKYYKLNIKNLALSKIYIYFAKKFFEQKDIDNAVRCAKTALIYDDKSIMHLQNILNFDNEEINIDDLDEQILNQGYCITPKIYKNIISYCHKNNIKYYIAMQYPTLSIELLMEDLKNSPYYDKLIFISNEENFKQALQKYKTEEIFRDLFGVSWGHCTELGNTIIAENVAETVLKLYN
ncbi:MAG: SGNH/GDSL hydrolase family protein [Elusimicrobia bacterium]|nr:SGNH/GDSL hydrolase family protein [Elusimicrobiota bacterium]